MGENGRTFRCFGVRLVHGRARRSVRMEKFVTPLAIILNSFQVYLLAFKEKKSKDK